MARCDAEAKVAPFRSVPARLQTSAEQPTTARISAREEEIARDGRHVAQEDRRHRGEHRQRQERQRTRVQGLASEQRACADGAGELAPHRAQRSPASTSRMPLSARLQEKRVQATPGRVARKIGWWRLLPSLASSPRGALQGGCGAGRRRSSAPSMVRLMAREISITFCVGRPPWPPPSGRGGAGPAARGAHARLVQHLGPGCARALRPREGSLSGLRTIRA